MAFTGAEFKNFFKFTFVRNPWDRLVSAFFFLKAGGYYERDRKWAERHLSDFDDFDEFVRRWVTRERIWWWKHFKPQSWFILSPFGGPEIDFLGYFENLDQDYELVRKAIGVGGPLKTLNVSKARAPYQEYYTKHTRQIVSDVYREDIRQFGYAFGRDTLSDQLAGRKPISAPGSES
jgi:hypothetical protein